MFYDNTQYSRKVLDLINEATTVAVTSSVALLEQQVGYFKENADRSLSRMNALPQFRSPEEVVDFQKKVGEDELTELKKTGASCYKIADKAGQEFIAIAKQGYELFEDSVGEAAQKTGSILPNGKSAFLTGVLQNSAQVANDMVQKSFDAATQAFRTSADNVTPAFSVPAKATVAKATTAKPRKATRK